MKDLAVLVLQVEKDLKSLILSIDFFDMKDRDNYECSFTLLNGRCGHAYKFMGVLEVRYSEELDLILS